MHDHFDSEWPKIRTVGVDGLLVSFADQLSEPANRAALAFRAAVSQSMLEGVLETSTSLVSTYLRFDPLTMTHAEMQTRLAALLSAREWRDAPLPEGRKFWRIPTVYDGPDLDQAADAAGMSASAAVDMISGTRVRVQTIGFAPGMPYLGQLPPDWNIPRQTQLTAQVPAGGLCVAIRQLVLFPVATPTGWHHIGRTAIALFRPSSEEPFLLRPGDEVLFEPVDSFTDLGNKPLGGAVSEPVA